MKNLLQSQQDSNSIINLLENKLTVTCDMCNHPVNDPQICPSCNQIFCYQCLAKYHQTNKNCPLCHQKLTLNQFLEFDCAHVLQFFRKQLKQLKLSKESLRLSIRQEMKRFGSSESNKNGKQKDHQQKCPDHEIPLKYFCQTCSKPICSDCGMMSGQHKNHKFIRLNDIYTKIKQKLNNELNRLTTKIFESQEHTQKINKKLQKLQTQHMHIKRYTQEYYILLVQKFEEQITAKTIYLKDIQEKNNSEIDFYELYRDGICEEIQRKSRNQLINDYQKILTSFTIQTCQPPEPLKIQESFQTIKQLLPEYNNFQFCLQNFSISTGGIVYSDPFFLNGVQWRLKIYPKGNGVAKGKYLSVFVEMTKAQRSQKKYEYKIELINKDLTSQNIRREYCSAFDIGQCWGYNQFILLEELVNGFVNQDKLYFIMGIRNPDYRSLSQDQSNHILKLENEVKMKQLQRQNQIEQTNIIDDLENHSYTLKSAGSHSNETKFLKFLQNSTFNEERINQRKQKQRQKQFEKSQKDQEFQDFHQIQQLRFKKQQRTTNNLQISDVVEVKPQRNEFFIRDYCSQKEDDFHEFEELDQRLNDKETLKRSKNQILREEQKLDKSRHIPIGFSHKEVSLRQKKVEKYHPTQSEQKPLIKPEIKLEKKEEKNLPKNEQKIEQKYEFYFSSSKKSEPESKKESRKHEPKTNSQEDGLLKKQLKLSQISKTYKNEFKQIKRSTQTKIRKKIEEQKLKRYEQEKPKRHEQEKSKKYAQQPRKYEEQKVKVESKEYSQMEQKQEDKKEGIKTKKYIKSSPPKIKNEMQESENRKKQISSILQQSKKLQGISEQKVKSFISNMSEVKDSSSNNSVLRSPVKNSQLRQEKEKEESRPSLKKLKQFQFQRN